MTRKHLFLSAGVAAVLAVGATGIAQRPVDNISSRRHGNLAAAQRLCTQAFERISAAQTANEFDLGGHAAKAKELLEQVNHELKEAAEASNRDPDHDHDRH